MLTNIMVLRTIKENANKAVLDALPSILFEGLHNEQGCAEILPARSSS